MAWISPDCSAIGMNSIGGTGPRLGCCHRSSASAPRMLRVTMSTIGWYTTWSSSRSRARVRSIPQLELLLGPAVHRIVEDCPRRLSIALRRVHRDVGGAQQCDRVGRRALAHDTGAGVDEHDRQLAVRQAGHAGEGMLDAVEQQRPVRQARERVVERLVPELGGQLGLDRHVVTVEHPPLDLRRIRLARPPAASSPPAS